MCSSVTLFAPTLIFMPPTLNKLKGHIALACVEPGIYARGVGGRGQSDKKSSDNVFFLFLRSQMANFKKITIFQGSRGSNSFQGGPTFSRGGEGSNCLFPIETQITCDFPGGPDPLSPLWIRTCLSLCYSASIHPLQV